MRAGLQLHCFRDEGASNAGARSKLLLENPEAPAPTEKQTGNQAFSLPPEGTDAESEPHQQSAGNAQ
jgi:hypothetical protein